MLNSKHHKQTETIPWLPLSPFQMLAENKDIILPTPPIKWKQGIVQNIKMNEPPTKQN